MGGARRGGNGKIGIGKQAADRTVQDTRAAPNAYAKEQAQRTFEDTAANGSTPPKADVTTGKTRRTNLHAALRKTKICMFHSRGTCQYSDDCVFAHSCSELSDTPDLRKTRLCKAYLNDGKCEDQECTFAHGEEELRSTNMFFKKTLCMWDEKGKCRNGDQCRFAHGKQELRDGPTKSGVDPKNVPSKPSASGSGGSASKAGRNQQQQSSPQHQGKHVLQQQQQRDQQQQQHQQHQQQQQQQHRDQHAHGLLLQREMMQMQFLQQHFLQHQLLPSHFGGLAMHHTGLEPMKVPIGVVPGAIHDNFSVGDAALKGELDTLRQKLSVLSLRCSQIQKHTDPQMDPVQIGCAPEVMPLLPTIPGLPTPPGLPHVNLPCQQFAEMSMRMAAAQTEVARQMETARMVAESQHMGVMYLDKLGAPWNGDASYGLQEILDSRVGG